MRAVGRGSPNLRGEWLTGWELIVDLGGGGGGGGKYSGYCNIWCKCVTIAILLLGLLMKDTLMELPCLALSYFIVDVPLKLLPSACCHSSSSNLVDPQ